MVNKHSGSVRGRFRVTSADTFDLARSIAISVAPGSSCTADDFSRMCDGDLGVISSYRCDPSTYNRGEVDRFQKDWLISNLLRKFPTLPGGKTPEERAARAFEKLLECESSCKDANMRIVEMLRKADNTALDRVFHTARRKIRGVLGQFSWDHVFAHSDFGPGATTRLPRSRSDIAYKIKGDLHLTADCLPLFQCFQEFKPGCFDGYKVVAGNKIITVPKDKDIDRPIAIEPDFNMFVQKGLGGLIRSRLKSRTKEKIDLNDQTHNQQLAKLASEGFGFATVDLSSASDTISTVLVRELLPYEWFEALALVRCRVGYYRDIEVRYQKWSSMGNGYTFELESLIFWALSQGVIKEYGNGTEYVSVYGDDIVISSHLFAPLVDVFSFFGFRINERKSFHSGWFFESCGKHYFDGTDVTPLYVDKVTSTLTERIALTNEIILLASRLGHGLYRDKALLPSVNISLTHLPPFLRRPVAPVSCKGNGVIGDFDECRPRLQKKFRLRGWEGYSFRGLVSMDVWTSSWIDETALQKSLYILDFRTYADGTQSAAVQTSCKKNYMKEILVADWSYLGPWL